MNGENRASYWRASTTNGILAATLLTLIILGASFLFSLMPEWHFLGFPFIYYFAAQGAYVCFIFSVFWLANRQEKIDRHHGTSEEI